MLELLVADPARTGVLCDFDGTLAEIVADPATAVPLPGATAVLGYLADHLGTVAVVSGRPLSFLERHLGGASDRLGLAGLYGLERSGPARDGLSGAEAERWRVQVATAVSEARAALPEGTRLEDKGLALALHYREAPHRADDVAALARRLAARHGLAERPAKLAVELVPPLPVDKGTVAGALAAGCAVVGFLGDDAGDLAAFEALAAMAARGELVAVRMAVAGDGTPGELLRAADLVLDGPPAALDFLAELATRLGWPGPP